MNGKYTTSLQMLLTISGDSTSLHR